MYPKNPSTTLRNDRNAHSRFVKCSGNPATCPCDVSASPTHTATGENGNFKTLVFVYARNNNNLIIYVCVTLTN